MSAAPQHTYLLAIDMQSFNWALSTEEGLNTVEPHLAAFDAEDAILRGPLGAVYRRVSHPEPAYSGAFGGGADLSSELL